MFFRTLRSLDTVQLAYEAADTGLLSPELAAGIRRVKGAKKSGMRLGNWLTSYSAGVLDASLLYTTVPINR